MNNFKSYDLEYCAEFFTNLAKENREILIITHRNPDGDAVGSSFALKKIYESLGGKAVCACQNKIPAYLKAVVGENEEFITEITEEYHTIVTVDTASPSQMGKMENLSDKVALSIDHHENHTPYAPDLRDGSASAAGEIVFKLYKNLVDKGMIGENADICRLLYTAISTDTGSFQYSNTTPETMLILSQLMKTVNSDKNGISTSEICRLLYHCRTLKEVLNRKVFIDNLRMTEDDKIGYIVLTREIIENNGLLDDELGAAIDTPRSINTVMCALVLKEEARTDSTERSFRMSLRSNCDVNVADICKIFGGGGHAKAAGGSVTGKTEAEALEKVLTEIRAAIRNA